ncbi:flagellar biosynthesis protein FliQ [uncultured Helicobacter sp.]|uniref:flagellar biosynthesis protein FliQ n=1 Tax=uncultured Helicobacter sp. TaxID=175537 RepID=UPI00262FE6D1|nr:flagellar biosynthesis protein FliQ [uncultured Helicobacter sp.]
MEAKLMALAIETYKITLLISLPMLLAGLIVGLLVSIFQATTQINEMTLTFVPKILAVIGVLIFTLPWMLNMILDYTKGIFDLIPSFPF